MSIPGGCVSEKPVVPTVHFDSAFQVDSVRRYTIILHALCTPLGGPLRAIFRDSVFPLSA